MSAAHDPARPHLPAPRSCDEVPGSPVHRTGPVTITTIHGTVVHLSGETPAQLVGPWETAHPRVRLTPREQQVLQTVATSATTAAAAERLGVVLNTVAQHLVAIRRKYRVRSTAEALTAARADGHVAPAADGA